MEYLNNALNVGEKLYLVLVGWELWRWISQFIIGVVFKIVREIFSWKNIFEYLDTLMVLPFSIEDSSRKIFMRILILQF